LWIEFGSRGDVRDRRVTVLRRAQRGAHAREAGSIASLGLASGTVTVRGIFDVLVREDTGVFASRHVGPLRARQSIG
jgi:hypothetical protein